MIIDYLNNLHTYAGLGSSFAKAINWLQATDLDSLPCGQIRIAGDEVFATLAENRLSSGEPQFEAHYRYADIQLILAGKERFLFGTKARIPEPQPDTDFYACEVTESMDFVLEPGMFTVFFPAEAHSPGNIAGTGPEICRKLVVKVLMTQT